MKRIALALFLFRIAFQVQAGPLQVEKILDWKRGALFLEVRRELEAGERLQPDIRYRVEAQIERLLPALFMDAILELTFDSYNTVGERISSDQALMGRLNELALEGVQKQDAHLARDRRRVQVRYAFSFFGAGGLIDPFIMHTRAFPQESYLGFEPSRTYTGLVIYARGEYPAHGKRGRERIRPALLPELYDEEMNLVLNAEMCDPVSLKKWGITAYTDSLDEGPFQERIGVFPLRTTARGVFGKNSTDILISIEAARKLLSRPGNQKLLRQGRILIILDQASSGPEPVRYP